MSSPRDKKLNATLAAESPTMTPKSAQVLGLSTPNMTHKTAKMMGVSTDVVAERSKSGTSKSHSYYSVCGATQMYTEK